MLWRIFQRSKSTRKVTPSSFSGSRAAAQAEADTCTQHFGDELEFWVQPDTDDVFHRLVLENLERIAAALEKNENI